MTEYLIRHRNRRGYYRCWTAIGPAFGATKKDAARFSSIQDAVREMSRHWAFVETDVERLDQSARSKLRIMEWKRTRVKR